MNPSSPWRTTRDAAARARCSTKVIYRAVSAGTLRAARVGFGPALRFRDEWIDEWLEQAHSPHPLVCGAAPAGKPDPEVP
jgi:excisionase family DNA binding protein